MIHIEGMGVLGMQVAWRLEELGLDFTWSDIDAPFTAWHCSTGIVYPSGNARDLDGLAWWRDRTADFAPYVEATPYVFAHKHPPHGGRYAYDDIDDPRYDLRVARDYPAVAINVPKLVTATRERFAHRRTEGAEDGELLVVAHSNTDRVKGYLWGWAARVTFDGPVDEVATYYAKKHRFNLTYAYPIPGDGQWWAGSTLKYQDTPKELDARPYLDEWLANAPELLGLENIEVHSLEQGWRPRRGPMSTPNEARYDAETNSWVMAPEPTSGLRHGPLIVDDLMERMGL